MLAIETLLPGGKLAVDTEMFMVKEESSHECEIGQVGDGKLASQVAQHVAYSVATRHVWPDADGFGKNQECNSFLRVVIGTTIPIAALWQRSCSFLLRRRLGALKVGKDARVYMLSYHSLVLLNVRGERPRVRIGWKGDYSQAKPEGDCIFPPLYGKPNRQYQCCPHLKVKMDIPCAISSPGQAKAPNSSFNINGFHHTRSHAHEVLLKQTAKQQRASIGGKMTSVADV